MKRWPCRRAKSLGDEMFGARFHRVPHLAAETRRPTAAIGSLATRRRSSQVAPARMDLVFDGEIGAHSEDEA